MTPRNDELTSNNFRDFIKIVVLETIRQRHVGTPSDEIVENILDAYTNGMEAINDGKK